MFQAEQLRTRPNMDSGLLKLIAILTMISDHVGYIFFPKAIWMQVIGRTAFPLFCWGIVIGAEKTKDWRRYALRLLVSGLITQPIYKYAFHSDWIWLNIMFTLLLGLLAIVGIQKNTYGSAIWAPALCLLISTIFPADFDWRGVLLILLLYAARHTRSGLAAVMVAFCLYWGSISPALIPPTLIQSLMKIENPVIQKLVSFASIIRFQTMAILALPFMLIHTKSNVRIPKWLGYAAYPGHLLILWLIRVIFRV